MLHLSFEIKHTNTRGEIYTTPPPTHRKNKHAHRASTHATNSVNATYRHSYRQHPSSPIAMSLILSEYPGNNE